MEERRVEEAGVALAQRELDVVLGEVGLEVVAPPGEVAGEVLVRVGQVERRPALQRHVAVRDRALEGQHRRQRVHVGRVAGDHLVGQEAEVVVAVRLLGLATRPDHVDLRGDLVAGAEPGRRRERDHVVGVVVDERLGGADGELLQRVPDPAVGARCREVVAGRTARGRLLGDDLVEDAGDPVDHRVVRERALEDDHPRPVGERRGPARRTRRRGRPRSRSQRGAGRRRRPGRCSRPGRRGGTPRGRSSARRRRRSPRDGRRRA